MIRTAICIGGGNGGSSLISYNNENTSQSISESIEASKKVQLVNKEISQIIIYDISGRQIERVSNKEFFDFRLQDFVNTGVYFIFTQYKDGSYDVQKMVNIY